MLELFRSWRRITGCLVLVIACAFMGACLKQRVERNDELASFQKQYPNHHLDKDGNTVFKTSETYEFVYANLSWGPDLFVAIPLTLLSAYLLLSKPSKRVSPLDPDGLLDQR